MRPSPSVREKLIEGPSTGPCKGWSRRGNGAGSPHPPGAQAGGRAAPGVGTPSGGARRGDAFPASIGSASCVGIFVSKLTNFFKTLEKHQERL